MLIFEQILDEQTKQIRNEYFKNIRYIFYKLALYYQKTDGVKKAYFAYIIGKYKIEDEIGKNILTNTLFMFLDEETMYCRDNALRAIIKLGNIKNILEVLKRIKKSKYYFSVEMLYENLLEYNKEKQISFKHLQIALWCDILYRLSKQFGPIV